MELTQEQIGPYRVDDELGRGHEAVVFRAEDTLYERDVALKILPPYLTREAERAREFISQGREAARLRHPNIVEVYDTGQADGYHYIAMQLAEGGTLERLLADKSGPWPEAEVIALVEQLASALDYAHTNGFVHGRLGPDNVLLSQKKRVLLNNFGASMEANAVHTLRLARDSVMDQLAYLAPEQAKGSDEIDRRTDIFSLGVLAYRLFTGEMPFRGGNSLALLRAIIESPLAPGEQMERLSPDVAAALKRAMAKDPGDRWQSAGEFAAALTEPPEDVEKAELAPVRNLDLNATPIQVAARAVKTPTTALKPAGRTVVAKPARKQTDASLWDKLKSKRTWAVAGIVAGMVVTVLLIFALLSSLVPSLRQLATDSAPVVENVNQRDASQSDGGQDNVPEIALNSTATATADIDGQESGIASDPITSTNIGAADAVTETHVSAPPAEKTEPPTADPTAVPMVLVPMVPYEAPDGTFSVALPADWQPSVGNELVRFGADDELPIEFFVKHLADEKGGRTAQALMKEYLAQGVLADDASLQNVRMIEERAYSNTAWQGHEQILQATHLGTPVLVRLLAVTNDEAAFILGSSVEPEQEALLGSVVSSIVNSFRIKAAAVAQAPTSTPTPKASPTVPPSPTRTDTPEPTATATPLPTETRELLAYSGGGFQADADDAELRATEGVSATDSALEAVPPPAGRIAYAVWNPHTGRMDTYLYNISNGISWPKLDNKRQPDFGPNGEMVFNGEGGGLDNLHRMKVTGQDMQIISEFAEDSRPHWSPSGKQVVFDSTSGGDRQHRIYLQTIRKSDDPAYTREVAPMKYQAWELFGRYPIFLANNQIAYNGCNVWENGGQCGIYLTTPDSTRPSVVTTSPQDFPTDNLGSRILFMSARSNDGIENWDVYAVNADGSNLAQLTVHPANDGLATASPDGNYIAFLTDREGPWSVYVMRPDGSAQRKLFDLNGEYGRNEQDWLYDWRQERMSWGW